MDVICKRIVIWGFALVSSFYGGTRANAQIYRNLESSANGRSSNFESIKFDDKRKSEQEIALVTKSLIKFIPDHKFKERNPNCFHKDLFTLLVLSFDMPSDGIGALGSDEWLAYFISSNGDCSCSSHPVTINHITYLNDSIARVFCNYYHKDHELDLIFINGRWAIYDFDNNKIKLKEYLAKQTQYFKSSKWQRYLKEIIEDNDTYFSNLALERKAEVDNFFTTHDMSLISNLSNSAIQKLRIVQDDIENNTQYFNSYFYHEKSSNKLSIYIKVWSSGRKEMRMRISTVGDDSLHFTDAILNINGQYINLPVYNKDVNFEYGFLLSPIYTELMDVKVSPEVYNFIKRIRTNDLIKIRLKNNNNQRDRTLSEQEKKAIVEILNAYESL